MQTDLQEGEYYTAAALSRYLGYSPSWLAVILQRTEFSPYRKICKEFKDHSIVKYCCCVGLKEAVLGYKNRGAQSLRRSL